MSILPLPVALVLGFAFMVGVLIASLKLFRAVGKMSSTQKRELVGDSSNDVPVPEVFPGGEIFVNDKHGQWVRRDELPAF